MKSRQKGLEEAIEKLLGKPLTEQFYQHALVNPLEDAKPSYISSSLFAKVVMGWMLKKGEVERAESKEADEAAMPWLIKLILDRLPGKSGPAKPDVKTALDKTVQENIKELARTNAILGEVLHTITVQAGQKTEKVSEYLEMVQKDLEAWFLETVNHMSSVYGARLQFKTLGVSLVVARSADQF